MQITFFTTAVLSLTQGALFRSNAVRSWLHIQPMPPPNLSHSSTPTGTMTLYQAPNSPTSSPQDKGVFGGAVAEIKGAASQIMAQTRKKVEQSQAATSRLSKAELRRAKEYEERRSLELEGEKKRTNRRADRRAR